MVRICALQPKKRRKNACADLTPPLSLSLSLSRVFKRGQEWKSLHRRIPITELDIAGSAFFGCAHPYACAPLTPPCFTLQPVPVRHSVMITAGCACMCVCVCVCVGHYDDVQLRRTDGAPSRGRPHQRCGTAVAPGCIQEALTSTQQAWGHSVCVDLFRLFFLDGGGNRVWMPPPPSNILCYCISFANTGAVVRQMHVHARVRVCGGGRGKVKYNTMTFPLGGGGPKEKRSNEAMTSV